jgi:hypothetical protein
VSQYLPIVFFVVILVLSILFTTKVDAMSSQDWRIYQAHYFGYLFDISYQITNGTVDQIEPDIADNKVSISIESNPFQNGTFLIKIPRNFMYNDFMNEFDPKVLIDGKEMTPKSQVVANSLCDNTVSINFSAGAKKIEIIYPYTNNPRSFGNGGFVATDKACYKQGEKITFFGKGFPSGFTVEGLEGNGYRVGANDAGNGSFVGSLVFPSGSSPGIYGIRGPGQMIGTEFWSGGDARFLLVNGDGNFTIGKTWISNDNGTEVMNAERAGIYPIKTQVFNNSTEPRTILYRVIIDNKGNTEGSYSDSFPLLANQKYDAEEDWMPKKLGEHTIKVLISSYQNNEPLIYTKSIDTFVTSKIVRLGICEKTACGYRLLLPPLSVKDMNFYNNTVEVGSYPCTGQSEFEQVLHVGQGASLSGLVNATFLGFQGGKSIFNYVPTGSGPCFAPICLSGNTVIDTPNGTVNIKELQDGMLVWTLDKNGHKQSAIIVKTSKISVPPTHMMMYIVLDDGRDLLASAGHPTTDGRFIGDLKQGDIFANSRVKSVERVPYNENYTYDILPSGSTGYYWANGILVGSTLK